METSNFEEDLLEPRHADVYATAAGFYTALLKSGYGDEASEFAEWFLETFDLDLES